MSLSYYPPENQKSPANDYFGQVGGPAVRALMLLRGFGAVASLLGAVGNDLVGLDAVEELQRRDIDVARVHTDERSPTRVAQVWLARDTGSRTVAYASNGPQVGSFDAQVLDGASALLLDGRHEETASTLVDTARSSGVPVALDMGGFKEYLPAFVPRADILIGSADTWRRLAEVLGRSDPVDLMHELGGATCILTQGPQRVVAVRASESLEYLPTPVDAIDSNGAGDVFFGAYVWAYTHGYSLAEGVRFASATAALKCTRLGNGGLPNLREIDGWLKSMATP